MDMKYVFSKLVSFRFSGTDLSHLDALVNHERAKGPVLFPGAIANRTSVLKALILREVLRLIEEERKIQEQLDKAKIKDFPVPASPLETSNGKPAPKASRRKKMA